MSLIGKEISWSRNGYGKSKYDSLYLRFNPKQFNAKEWVKLAQAGGMKYLVLTSKHHDGFCLFDTKTTPYNIMNSPFGRDVCKELAQAAHEAGMPIGWYFSVADWKDPDCRNPKTNDVFANRVEEQVRELLSNYGKISLLWIDYEGAPSPIPVSYTHLDVYKRQLIACALGAIALVAVAIVSTGYVSIFSLAVVGLFTSVMYPILFTLSIKNLGAYTKTGSSLIIMSIVGGAIVPPLMGLISDMYSIRFAFLLPVLCYAYILYYAQKGHIIR